MILETTLGYLLFGYGEIADGMWLQGTRGHVYRWLDNTKARKFADEQQLNSLPQVTTKDGWTKKVHPGVSTFGPNPEQVGPDHLETLLQHALEKVPENEVKNTPLFLLATAGMRLLPDLERTELLESICSYARSRTDFLLPDCDLHIQVIPGETEALYGWIATNYLLGGFDAPGEHDHGKGHHTYGFLDMGGASAQLAFAPNATEVEKHANDLKLLRLRNIDGAASEYQVFVTTWLGFGVNEARRRYIEALLEGSDAQGERELPDPCLPSGLVTTTQGEIVPFPPEELDNDPYLLGTGQFQECLRQTYPLLEKDAPCDDDPCLLNGVHVPAIDFDVNHFIGISEYWHTTHEIFEMSHKDKAYDFNTYQQRVQEFCSQDWVAIDAGVVEQKWGKKVDRTKAYEVCFKASWIINVLHDGIGIPRVGLEDTEGTGHNGTEEVLASAKDRGYLDAFQAINKIDSTEVSWTLGKAVLYAASQVPPLDESRPVGFGSNVAGVPDDFQHPGSSLPSLPVTGPVTSEPESHESSGDYWRDTLFDGDSPRRIPGILLFALIVVIVLFFLCGRDRRSRMSRKVRSLFRCGRSSLRKRGHISGKIPFLGRGTPTSYDRVEDLPTPYDFELEDVESDDNSASDIGVLQRSQSWHTPSQKFAFDSDSLQGVGLGLMSSGNAMDRSGLVVRTESRESLSPMALGPTNNGRRSRAGSPVRHKTPLMTQLDERDI